MLIVELIYFILASFVQLNLFNHDTEEQEKNHQVHCFDSPAKSQLILSQF